MFDAVFPITLILAALGAGLMAGVYFAFSTFIMQSLNQLGAAQAADAMNSINKVILNSWFMYVFFGSSLLYAGASIYALLIDDLPGRWFLFGVGALYVVGMFLCTAMFNVPLNNRLAASAHEANAKTHTWLHYRKVWTRWNHVRSVASLASLLLTILYVSKYL